MSGLFRSETMVYVRMLMPEETAYATVKEMGKFARAHVVDLGMRHTHSVPSDRLQTYKKRVATAAFYERKLQSFLPLFRQYRVEDPSIDAPIIEIAAGDVLEEVRTYLEPLESTVTKNVLYAREQRIALNALEEETAVLRMCGAGEATLTGGSSSSSAAATTTPLGPGGRKLSRERDRSYGSFSEDNPLLSEDDEGDDEDDEENPDVERKSAEIRRARAFFTTTIHGIINEDRFPFFERMVFRVSRGNALVKVKPIPNGGFVDPDGSGAPLRKVVFSLFFLGDQIGKRLRKIISHFGGTEYEVRGDYRSIQKQIGALTIKIADTKGMLKATELQTRAMLQAIVWDPLTRTSPYQNYAFALRVEKNICDTLKKCEVEREGSSVLQCDAWIPEDAYTSLQAHLIAAVASTGAQAAASEIITDPSQFGISTPPTYFKTNKFTEPYQGIVDTYGVPRYKEVNPGLFTIISFPFLFGVMYGDVGHGTLLTLGALWFILNEKYYNDLVRRKQMDEIIGMVYGGRYMLIAMGIFAVYAGTIYNDCFSIPLNLFGTRFRFGSTANSQGIIEGAPIAGQQHYPYGVDPSWYHTSNELAFFNSLKMKLAVTLGVTQMTFGIILSAFNHSYFSDPLSMYFEFLPRIIFMLSTFGYMIFIILFKFCVDWTQSPVAPPNLVQTMIAMFLAPGKVDEDKQLYAGQAQIQAFLLLLALCSVPVMLLAQPLIARAQHNKLWPNKHEAVASKRDHRGAAAAGSHYQSVPTLGGGDDGSDEEEQKQEAGTHHVAAAPAAAAAPASDSGHGSDPRSEHYNFSDHAITQGIHTIEFVLGAVSNTASYLRLWALSLAHAELSAVFWDKMISQIGLESANPLGIVIGMAAWSGATFAVLLAMDVLECFLHALRLHWVEFQNKFFHADGYAYKPFNFTQTEVAEA